MDRIARALVVCILAFLASRAHATDGRDSGYVQAVWKAQNIVFNYRSAGRVYPCEILEYKIKLILLRLGARERIELKRASCRDLAGRARFEVRLESPFEATPDNIRAITRYDGEDELIARMRGVQLPSPAELERFPAMWIFVPFRKLDLDAGDCALVRQLRRQVLPRMSIQVVKDLGAADCSPDPVNLAKPRLAVLALVRVELPRSRRD